jgi:hypothetical protein
MIYDHTDIEQLTDKMRPFLLDSAFRDEMGRKGREYVLRKHSLATFALRLANTLRGE